MSMGPRLLCAALLVLVASDPAEAGKRRYRRMIGPEPAYAYMPPGAIGAYGYDGYAAGSGDWWGFWPPGGYDARVGSPYYYRPTTLGPQGAFPYAADPYAAEGMFPPYGPAPYGPDAYGPDAYGPAPFGPAPYGPPALAPAPFAGDPALMGAGDPYEYHFGPGFQRHETVGHYRFPYYNYRAPWYFPGHAVFNRDTNFPW